MFLENEKKWADLAEQVLKKQIHMKKMSNDNLYEWNLAITIHNDKIKNALKKKKENDLKHRKKMRTIEQDKDAKYKATRKKTAQMRAQSVQHVSRLQ